MSWIQSTACPVTSWTAVICWAISSVAWAVWLARCLTSDATTAKPLPASPAPCRLDRRVERQQVGLARDVGNHLDDRADPARGFRQAGDDLVGRRAFST